MFAIIFLELCVEVFRYSLNDGLEQAGKKNIFKRKQEVFNAAVYELIYWLFTSYSDSIM